MKKVNQIIKTLSGSNNVNGCSRNKDYRFWTVVRFTGSRPLTAHHVLIGLSPDQKQNPVTVH